MTEDSFGPLKGRDALAEYVSKYRRAGLPPLRVSPPFDLYPSRPVPSGIHPEGTWADHWPFYDKAGVYMLYTNTLEFSTRRSKLTGQPLKSIIFSRKIT
jgi:hypothetical protein